MFFVIVLGCSFLVNRLIDSLTLHGLYRVLIFGQGQGRNLLTKLGDSSICWQGLENKEVNIMQEVVQVRAHSLLFVILIFVEVERV